MKLTQIEANVFFDGRVTNRDYVDAEDRPCSLGIMLPGEYKWATGRAETFTVLQGRCEFRNDGCDDWVELSKGGTYTVPADTIFEVRVSEVLDYRVDYGADD